MKRSLLTTFAVCALSASSAFAQDIVDLPNPTDGEVTSGTATPILPDLPIVAPAPTATPVSQNRSGVPIPTPRPRWDGKLVEGDIVYVTYRDTEKAVVLGLDNSKRYIVRYLSGPSKGQIDGGFNRETLSLATGCGIDYCVGDVVYNVERNDVKVRVVAIDFTGTATIEYLDGDLKGGKGAGWSSDNLSTLQQCAKNICVGQKAYVSADRGATYQLGNVVGIQKSGGYVVEVKPEASWRFSNLANEMIARASGCGVKFCVGDTVTNISREYVSVQIMGVQSDGKYLLKFLEGSLSGGMGGGWGDDDLRKFKY